MTTSLRSNCNSRVIFLFRRFLQLCQLPAGAAVTCNASENSISSDHPLHVLLLLPIATAGNEKSFEVEFATLNLRELLEPSTIQGVLRNRCASYATNLIHSILRVDSVRSASQSTLPVTTSFLRMTCWHQIHVQVQNAVFLLTLWVSSSNPTKYVLHQTMGGMAAGWSRVRPNHGLAETSRIEKKPGLPPMTNQRDPKGKASSYSKKIAFSS